MTVMDGRSEFIAMTLVEDATIPCSLDPSPLFHLFPYCKQRTNDGSILSPQPV
jgi:hypothetical protein